MATAVPIRAAVSGRGTGADPGTVRGRRRYLAVTTPAVRSRIVIETRAPAPARRPSTWLARLTGAAERHPGRTIAAATLVVGLPLLVALVALRGAQWYPVLDLAMTEYRVRDVFGAHTPLIGLPGRIGTFPNQGSHPGPLSFYLLAPTYRALGASSWALEAATVAIHLAAMATALWIGQRRLGWRGVAVVGALLALVVRGYGQVPLTQPWNPYLPLLAWIVVLLAAWAVLCGDHVMVVPLVVAASYCAQTHVPYLGLGVGMVVLGLASPQHVERAMAQRRLGHRHRGRAVAPAGCRPADQRAGQPPPVGRPLRVATGGSAGRLRGVATRAPPPRRVGRTRRSADRDGQLRRGDLGVARRGDAGRLGRRRWWSPCDMGPPALRSLHVVVGAGLAARLRVDGADLRAAVVLPDAVGVGSDGVARRRRAVDAPSSGCAGSAPDRDLGDGVAYAGGLVAVVVSVATAAAFVDAEHPEERLSAAVGALAGPTYDAVVGAVGEATGADGRYLVQVERRRRHREPGVRVARRARAARPRRRRRHQLPSPGHRPPHEPALRHRRPDPPGDRELHRHVAQRARRGRGGHVRPADRCRARRVRRGAQRVHRPSGGRGTRRPRSHRSTRTCSACRPTRGSLRPTMPTSDA